jgi:hypothetical protein
VEQLPNGMTVILGLKKRNGKYRYCLIRITMSKYEVWLFLNGIKEDAVSYLSEDKWLEVKLACDEMFETFTHGQYAICPGWFIGAL